MPQAAVSTVRCFTFGRFELIPEQQLLLDNKVPVRIGGRALDILTVLVERPGEVVTKSTLMSRVWPKSVVEEANLKVNMAALRRALGTEGEADPYIATVVGRGYRFVVAVQLRHLEPATAHVAGPAKRNNNLPMATTRIVGREDAIAGIQQELAEARLVSIVGIGGIGKTTVALAVAERLTNSCRDGVWLVELATLKEAALVPNAIATALGLGAHSANVLATICEYLLDRELLLILDSCEHLIDAAAACASRIITAAPGARILVTTREPLRVKGERVRRLPTLDTPAGTGAVTVAQALAAAAVQLFVDRATDRQESFQLDEANAQMVSDICRKLDGLALAIELAATRVDVFGTAELLRQLDDRLSVLKGHRAAAERHRTLAATIEWSYDLLSSSERTLLRRLSVFAAGFSLTSASAVAADDSIPTAQVVDDLAELVAKSLVSPEERDAQVEYRLLDTTRSYALEKLEGLELQQARRRHAEYFLRIAEQAATEARSSSGEEWLARNVPRIDDLRNALNWTFSEPGQIELGMALTVAAVPFWERLSLLEECRIAVERALESRFDAHRNARQTRVLNLALAAAVLYTRGPLPVVKSALETAQRLAQQAGDAPSELECLRGISEYELWAGHTRSALTTSDRVRDIATASGDVNAGEKAAAQSGSVLRYLGNLVAAQSHLETAINREQPGGGSLVFFRFEFDQRLAALGSLAHVLWLRGFPDQAVAMAVRQRAEAEAARHAVPLCATIVLNTLGVASFVGDRRWAAELMQFIEKYTVDHRLDMWAAGATVMRGRWLLDLDRPFEVQAFRHAMAQLLENGLRIRHSSMLANLGEGLAQLGDFEGSLASFNSSLVEAERSNHLWGFAEILRMKGNMLRKQAAHGFHANALACYGQSLRWATEQGALSWELRTRMSVVELWRAVGGNEQAERDLASTYERFTEGFNTGDLRRARDLMATRPSA